MEMHPAIADLAQKLVSSQQRHQTHAEIQPRVKALCEDRDFLHDAIRTSISRPGFLDKTKDLTIHLAAMGDVMVNINIFVPTRDGARFITQDNVHHHGWRLLTTGVLSGGGYDTIEFVPRSHERRDGDRVLLEVADSYHHGTGDVRFIGEHTAHVVFHPDSTTATLAFWSADKHMTGQAVKRKMQAFPRLRNFAVTAIRRMRLESTFGVNKTRGLYYHPYRGRMVETLNYRKPWDGRNDEMLNCMFRFFQQVEFTDQTFWESQRKNVGAHVVPWIDKLLSGEPIFDTGVWGHPRRRFTRTQILQAIDPRHPSDHC